MKIASCRIVGAMTLPHGKAAFDRANVIVESKLEPGSYVQVRSYVGLDELTGKALSAEELDALVEAEQAIKLDVAREAAFGAALWVFRPSFQGREAPLAELRTSGALIHDDVRLPDQSWGCLVREQEAFGLRDRWAEEAFEEALSWARSGRWAFACNAASRAFVLERAMTPSRIALLSLSHERTGNEVRAKGYLQMARNSRGDDFAEQVIAYRAELSQKLDESAPPSGTRTVNERAIRHGNTHAVRSGLQRLRRAG